MSAISLVMSSGSSSALRSGVDGLGLKTGTFRRSLTCWSVTWIWPSCQQMCSELNWEEHRPDAGLWRHCNAYRRHSQVPLRQCWWDGLLRPSRAPPPLLLVFFGKCRWFGLFTWLSLLLLVLHSSVAVPSQKVILYIKRRKTLDSTPEAETNC